MANMVQANPANAVTAGFSSLQGFELLQRMANMFASSKLVPQAFQKNIGDCCIALNMAQRLGADPLMVMQNLYVVYGNPAWSSKFMIATFNQCGRYSSIHYKETGKKGTDSWGCIAYAKELATGETIEGPEVTIQTAKDEGWYNKSGSKWKTMPQQMLRYRAAAWFIRTTAPEISMGLQTVEEAEDVGMKNITPPTEEIAENANSQTFEPKKPALKEAKKQAKSTAVDADVIPPETVKKAEKAEKPATQAKAQTPKQEALIEEAEEGPDF